jgi:hypothetical protein
MPQQKDHPSPEVRLAAIEYVLTQVGKVALINAGGEKAAELVTRMREAARGDLTGQMFPGAADPALADRFADELQQAVDRILSGVEEVVRHQRPMPL